MPGAVLSRKIHAFRVVCTQTAKGQASIHPPDYNVFLILRLERLLVPRRHLLISPPAKAYVRGIVILAHVRWSFPGKSQWKLWPRKASRALCYSSERFLWFIDSTMRPQGRCTTSNTRTLKSYKELSKWRQQRLKEHYYERCRRSFSRTPTIADVCRQNACPTARPSSLRSFLQTFFLYFRKWSLTNLVMQGG